ncbi:MAG: hypothetical protein JWO05_396 [Gemmatimonadetes bacterium]|nr:hypothetical protein [Gemmatimonadota bacterium]
MQIAVQLEPPTGIPPVVEYRWDADTDILTAHFRNVPTGAGLSGTVELEGADGSWLVLDVNAGRIQGVEVAVWPDVRKLRTLVPPAHVEDANIVVPARRSQPNVASLEVEIPLVAESDEAERVIHFRLGAERAMKTVRLGQDLLLDLDAHSRIAGVWFLNVPPFPVEPS